MCFHKQKAHNPIARGERSECDPPKGNELCKKETKGKEERKEG